MGKLLVDMCQKGWALRCLREAIDEIKIVKKDNRAFDLIFDAFRKVEMAVYYSLGEPRLIENIINDIIEKGYVPDNPILKCLLEIRKSIKILEEALNNGLNETFFNKVDNIILVASKMIELMTSLCTED